MGCWRKPRSCHEAIAYGLLDALAYPTGWYGVVMTLGDNPAAIVQARILNHCHRTVLLLDVGPDCIIAHAAGARRNSYPHKRLTYENPGLLDTLQKWVNYERDLDPT